MACILEGCIATGRCGGCMCMPAGCIGNACIVGVCIVSVCIGGVCIVGVGNVERRFGDGCDGEGIVTERPSPEPDGLSSGCLRFLDCMVGEFVGDVVLS